VKLTGIYDTPYFVRAKPIGAGTCEYVSFSDFAEPSRKRMQMPPNEKPVKVELLVEELLVDHWAIGYTSIQPK
jgi:hypothetical protein